MSALSSPSTSAAEAPPAANGGSSIAGWPEAVRAVAKALDPAQPQLQRNLDTLQATLEANQASGHLRTVWQSVGRSLLP